MTGPLHAPAAGSLRLPACTGIAPEGGRSPDGRRQGGTPPGYPGTRAFFPRVPPIVERSSINTVLHLSSSSGPGGAEMVVSRLAGALDPTRFRSIVCLSRSGWLQEQCDQHGVPTVVLHQEHGIDWRWLRSARHLIHRCGATVIHAHEFTANAYGAVLARLAGIPLIATVHGKNYYADKVRRRLAYRIVARSARLVAVSEDLKQFLVRAVGIPPHLITVIHNGVPVPEPASTDTIRRLKHEIGLDPSDRVVGTVGSLYPVKGHQFLLEAIPQVLQRFPQTTVLIIGQGELESALNRDAQRLRINGRVRFLGLRADVRDLLALLEVFVLPSLSEGLSIAGLEAMASGKPLIATEVGGNPELVLDGETGFLIPPRDPGAIASRLVFLLTHPEDCRRLGDNARRHVLTHFSQSAMLDKYQGLYERALRNGSG